MKPVDRHIVCTWYHGLVVSLRGRTVRGSVAHACSPRSNLEVHLNIDGPYICVAPPLLPCPVVVVVAVVGRWRVQATYSWPTPSGDRETQTSLWSAYTNFTTGIRTLTGWRGAQWIEGGPYLTTTLRVDNATCSTISSSASSSLSSVPTVARATVFVSGLGWYTLTVNGVPVGDRHLDVGWTRYNKRVLYTSFDVTDMMCGGGGGGEDRGRAGSSTDGSGGVTVVVEVSLGGGHFADVWYNGDVFQGQLLFLMVRHALVGRQLSRWWS